MTFHERGDMLKALAQYLMEHKKEFYGLSTQTGATRADSWIDIDGGISTLFVFSSKARREMPNDHVYLDGPPEQISRNGTFVGQHIYTPKLGAAVHINAFNFPVLGNAREARTDAGGRRPRDRQTGVEHGLPDRDRRQAHHGIRATAGGKPAADLRRRR